MALSLGPITRSTPVVLAPMAGVTDAPFRRLCAEHGEVLAVSEMVTARGLVEGNARSWAMVRPDPDAPGPRSLQLYGADPAVMGAAVAALAGHDVVDHVDLNVGCPVAKVMRGGGGAALPVKRRLFAAVVRAAVEAAGPVPVTVKMRLGLDEERLTFLDAGATAAEQGAAAVALHARTAVQGYGGHARWEAIAELRRALDGAVPVLGNGDLWAAGDALAMVEATGCDGVVVGRGCLGRPWLFADLEAAFAGRRPAGPPPLGEIRATARRHLDLLLAHAGADAALRRFRKHLRWYLQGYPVGRRAHAAAGSVASVADVETLLADLDGDLTVVEDAVRAPRGRTGGVGRLALPEGWWEERDAEPAVCDPAVAVSGG
ncbi:MAG: tRNA dihydrouridine synthase DusB [Egibacteraceae bacterium]